MPVREGSFEISSRLAAPAAEVWAFATTAAGINEELMPFDWDDIGIEQRACTVTDSIRFVPRVPALAPLLRPIFLRTFRHRHRRLRRRYGVA